MLVTYGLMPPLNFQKNPATIKTGMYFSFMKYMSIISLLKSRREKSTGTAMLKAPRVSIKSAKNPMQQEVG